ncbi:hypothetical protein ACF09C_04385 [Streptomyces sp. NPDC014870]|uniref:hypothetical protein n=1 Tax=Streptomyces sp. NPDC014870 TaxID=3364925 RepID=UPI0036F89797
MGDPAVAPAVTPWCEDRTETELMKIARINPTTGYFSDTDANKGASASGDFYTALGDIVAGRKPLSSFEKEILPKWRRSAGDAIRREYEKALAQGGAK